METSNKKLKKEKIKMKIKYEDYQNMIYNLAHRFQKTTNQELSEMDQLIDLIREETEAAGLDLRDICSIECPDCGFLIMI